MKIVLALIMCSYTAGTCLPPYIYHEKINDQYDKDYKVIGYELEPIEEEK